MYINEVRFSNFNKWYSYNAKGDQKKKKKIRESDINPPPLFRQQEWE